MTSVTVVGSINIDLTSYLDRWPKIGETISVRETVTSLGGKGANQAVAAAVWEPVSTSSVPSAKMALARKPPQPSGQKGLRSFWRK